MSGGGGRERDMFAPLRRRLVLANVLVIAGIIVALGIAVLALMDGLLIDQQASTLTARATEATGDLRFDPRDFGSRQGDPGSGTFYLLWDAGGNLVAETAAVPVQVFWPSAHAAATGSGAPTRATVSLATGQVLVVSVPLEDGAGVVQAAASLQPVRDAEARFTLLVLAIGGLGLLLSVAAAWFLAERSMVPIRRAFARQREFTADASHDLRTPLSVIDAGLQVLERHPDKPVAENADVLQAMRQQMDQMGRLVGALLTLARADAGAAQLQFALVDVDELVRGAAASFAPLAGERGAVITVRSTTAGTAVVDADRIRELLGILIDNAIRHGGPGVHVSLASRRTSGQVEVEVADDGPGIPEADRERALERFRRGDASRTEGGSGLGLAIAAWIASAHRGRLALEDNGPGLRVRLSLPQ